MFSCSFCRFEAISLDSFSRVLDLTYLRSRTSSFTSLSQHLADQLSTVYQLLVKCFKGNTFPNSSLPELYLVLETMLKNSNLYQLDQSLSRLLFNVLLEMMQSIEIHNLHHNIDCLSALLESARFEDEGLLLTVKDLVRRLSASDQINIRLSLLNLLVALGGVSPLTLWFYSDVLIFVRSDWETIYPILVESLSSNSIPVIVASLKVLESFAHSANDEASMV
jgi:hypothetical protein